MFPDYQATGGIAFQGDSFYFCPPNTNTQSLNISLPLTTINWCQQLAFRPIFGVKWISNRKWDLAREFLSEAAQVTEQTFNVRNFSARNLASFRVCRKPKRQGYFSVSGWYLLPEFHNRIHRRHILRKKRILWTGSGVDYVTYFRWWRHYRCLRAVGVVREGDTTPVGKNVLLPSFWITVLRKMAEAGTKAEKVGHPVRIPGWWTNLYLCGLE